MLIFRLTMKTYLSPQLHVYPFMAQPVHLHTFIAINRLNLPVNVSSVLHVHRCICSSLYLFSLFLLFRHNMHIDLSTHLWVPIPTDPPENKFTCLLSCFSFAQELPTYLSSPLLVYLPIAIPVRDPTCSFSFRLIVKIYPSTFPLFYMSTHVPAHQYTCSVYFSA